jgi:hypothetical protein
MAGLEQSADPLVSIVVRHSKTTCLSDVRGHERHVMLSPELLDLLRQ